MKRVGKPWFFVVALIICALAYFTFFGAYSTDENGEKVTIIRGVKDIRWGTDIQGGVSVTFGPSEGIDATDAQLNGVKAILDARLTNSGVTDYELYVDKGSDRIMVSFPWKDGESQDVQETIDELSATALLLFVEGVPDGIKTVYTDESGTAQYVEDFQGVQYNVALEGKHVDESAVKADQNGRPAVGLSFTEEGTKRFAASTAKMVGNYISIWMDGMLLSAPTVDEAIDSGDAIISSPNGFEGGLCSQIVNNINSGALPFTLETKDYSVVDPTLGRDSLKAMAIAGIIAFIVVCLFMLFYYRLPGFVACIALLGQAAGSLAMVSGLFPKLFNSFTLTLPGIAGIILSIGMGVDANIITNERIREEIRKGKTIDGAIDSGNENSFSSIFDGNITVIIVAVILMGVFGPPDSLWSKLLTPFLFMFPAATTGAIYSFGYTLLVGVIFNFLMGVTASRIMLKSLSRFKAFRKRWLFGGADEK